LEKFRSIDSGKTVGCIPLSTVIQRSKGGRNVGLMIYLLVSRFKYVWISVILTYWRPFNFS